MARVQVKSLGAGSVSYKDGSAYSNATVAITVASSGATATLFSDATTSTTLPNPTTTNSEGEIPGYLATGTYRFVVTSPSSEALDNLIVDVVSSSDAGGGGGSGPTGAAGGSLAGTYPNPTIAGNAITAAEIAADAVGTSEIAADAVGNSELAPSAVTDVEVAAANKDGAAGTASMRTLGTGATQAAAGNADVPKSTVTTKGDVIAATGSGAVTRLPAGTNYQHLVADSATATGLRWRTGDYVRVKDYATGDGTTDDTTAFQTAVDAAAAAGKPLYIDPGYTYLINGTVNVNHQRFRWIMPFSGVNTFTQTDAGSKILCGNLTGPCIVFGSAAATLTGIYVHGLRVWAKADRYRVPMVRFGDSSGAREVGYLHCYDLYADGGDFYTDAFQFFGVYNCGVYSSITTRMSGGISYDVRCGAGNVGNIGFYNAQAYHGGIGWAINQGVPGNLLNSVKLDNCKYGGAAAASRTFVSAVVSGTEAIGQTVITVNDATGITTNHWATVVAANGRSWSEKVSAVAGNDVTLKGSTGIPFALAAGDLLVVGNWHTVTGGGLKSLLVDLPHWEDCNGLLAAGVQGAEVRAPYVGGATGTHRGVYLAREAQQVALNRATTAFGSPIPTGAALFHQANHTSNQRNSVRNCNKSDWPAFADATASVLRVDGGAIVNNNERFGGVPAMLGVWHQDTTVAASQTNVRLIAPNGRSGAGTNVVTVPHHGAVVGLQVRTTSARTNGSLTATLFLNGSTTGLTAVLDGTNTTVNTNETENSSYPLAPNDQLDVRITTDGTWAPTANNVDVTVWVEQ